MAVVAGRARGEGDDGGGERDGSGVAGEAAGGILLTEGRQKGQNSTIVKSQYTDFSSNLFYIFLYIFFLAYFFLPIFSIYFLNLYMLPYFTYFFCLFFSHPSPLPLWMPVTGGHGE